MRVAIRTDASAQIGTGHVRRCLSFARALVKEGARVQFVCRDLGLDVGPMLANASLEMTWLPAPATIPKAPPESNGAACPPHADWARVDSSIDVAETVAVLAAERPDWVVLDHYAFDASWHCAVRQRLATRLAVIDDLADRTLDADLLLDHNFHPDHAIKYGSLLAHDAACLWGPRYALIDPVYAVAPRYDFSAEVRSMGVFLGGVDANNLSAMALRACREAGFTGPVEIVTTSSNDHLTALQEAAAVDGRSSVLVDLPDLAAFFARHDLHIGAGGGATWERCCIGAPTVGIVCADNQLLSMPYLHELGVLYRASPIGHWSSLATSELSAVIGLLLTEPASRLSMSERGRALVDGRGAERAAVAVTTYAGAVA